MKIIGVLSKSSISFMLNRPKMKLLPSSASWIASLIIVTFITLPVCELRSVNTASDSDSRTRSRQAKTLKSCPPSDERCFKASIQRAMRRAEGRIFRRLEERLHTQNRTSALTQLGKLWHSTRRELIAVQGEFRRQDANLLDVLEQQRQKLQKLEEQVVMLNRSLQKLTENASLANMTTGQEVSPPISLQMPIDCQEALELGRISQDGESHYTTTLQPRVANQAFQASCRLINSTAWTVIQRREDGSVDFFRTWAEYKSGFGDLDGELWLGNQHIFKITNQGDYRLRIEMETWEGQEFWAEYDHFRISDEDDKYRLHVSGYHGNAGDSLTSQWKSHDGAAFSTRDADNDKRFYDNCANDNQGGWWFTNCYDSHLNGVYYTEGEHNEFFTRDGILWNSIHLHSSLRRVEMMVHQKFPILDEITNGID